eukprot:1146334-Pelagomonas_calceolata.AAC.2
MPSTPAPPGTHAAVPPMPSTLAPPGKPAAVPAALPAASPGALSPDVSAAAAEADGGMAAGSGGATAPGPALVLVPAVATPEAPASRPAAAGPLAAATPADPPSPKTPSPDVKVAAEEGGAATTGPGPGCCHHGRGAERGRVARWRWGRGLKRHTCGSSNQTRGWCGAEALRRTGEVAAVAVLHTAVNRKRQSKQWLECERAAWERRL